MRIVTHQAPDNPVNAREALARFLLAPEPVIRVLVKTVEGSAPREEGAFMLVSPTRLFGTIGGGFAEFDAIDHARSLLREKKAASEKITLLGPDSGQCCGGRLTLSFAEVTEEMTIALLEQAEEAVRALPLVALFGAGHVGHALVTALSPLPLRLLMVETRAEALSGLPQGLEKRLTAMPEMVIADLPPGAIVLILTHDHALDFLIATEALKRDDLAYVGMIGSASKRASFAGHFRRDGNDPALLDRLTLPIGGERVKDKRPAVIAAMVAAELLSL